MSHEEDEGFVIEFTPDPELVEQIKNTQDNLIQVQQELQLALNALGKVNEAGTQLAEAANRVLSLVPDTDEATK